jgi:uncharacterized membrane protein HdeD (DUF308 family)
MRIAQPTRAEIRAHWPWFAAVGAGMLGVGAAALVCVVMVKDEWWGPLPGMLLVMGGALYGMGFFTACGVRACTVQALVGASYLVAGLFVALDPLLGSLLVNLAVVALLVLVGAAQTVRALWVRHRQWLSAATAGLAMVGLGVTIPVAVRLPAPWLVGLVVGVALCAQGAAYLRLGKAGQRLAAPFAYPIATTPSVAVAPVRGAWASGT